MPPLHATQSTRSTLCPVAAAVHADRGVDVTSVKQTSSSPTRDVYVTRKLDGDRVFDSFGQDTNTYCDCFIDAAELPVDKIQAAEVLVMGTLGTAYPRTREALHRARDLAKEAGTTVFVDVNWRPVFFDDPERALESVLPVVHGADLVKITDEEVEWALGLPAARALEHPEEARSKDACACVDYSALDCRRRRQPGGSARRDHACACCTPRGMQAWFECARVTRLRACVGAAKAAERARRAGDGGRQRRGVLLPLTRRRRRRRRPRARLQRQRAGHHRRGRCLHLRLPLVPSRRGALLRMYRVPARSAPQSQPVESSTTPRSRPPRRVLSVSSSVDTLSVLLLC